MTGISFNTAASANGAGASETSQNLTIPAGVLAHDVMLLVVHGFSNGASGSVTISASSTGTSFTQIGAQQVGGAGASGFNAFGAIFYVQDASAGDAGKVITGTINNPGGSNFMALSVAAYTGASNTAPIDVSNGTNSASSPLTFPALTTGVAGDWAIFLSAFGESTNATFTGPSGTTRTTTESGGVGSGIWDSNASVGPAGTGIGGASEQFSSTSATVWLDGWTIGLAPVSSLGQPQLQHSVYWLRSHPQQRDPGPPPPPVPQPQPQHSASWLYKNRQQQDAGASGSVTVAVTLADQAAASDQLAVSTAVEQPQQSVAWLRRNPQQQDTGQGQAGITLTDQAAAADALSVAAAITLADQAATLDVDQVSTAVEQPQQSTAWLYKNRQQQDLVQMLPATVSDQAAAADSLTVAQTNWQQNQQVASWNYQHRQQQDAAPPGTFITLADQAATNEALSVAVAAPLADQAAAVDNIAVSTAVEQPQHSVSWLRQFRQQQDAGFTVAFITITDQAAATEVISPAVAAALGDQAAAGEALAIAAAVPVAEQAAAGEALSAVVAVSLAEQAAATEAIVVQTPFSIPLAEAAAAAEGLTVSRTAPGNTGSQAWFAQAALPRWIPQAMAARWAGQPASSRWRILMSTFPPIAARSLEDVNIEWTSTLAGTKIDPTGQTTGQPLLSVNFAFPLSSGNLLAPAQPVAWFAGSWLQGGNAAFYVAQCLVGPSPGVVQLTAGQVYDVWCQILGSPEQPAHFAGQLVVY